MSDPFCSLCLINATQSIRRTSKSTNMELRNKSVQHILYCFKVAVPGNLLQGSRRKRQPPISGLEVSAFRVAAYGRFDCTLKSSCYDIINIMHYSL